MLGTGIRVWVWRCVKGVVWRTYAVLLVVRVGRLGRQYLRTWAQSAESAWLAGNKNMLLSGSMQGAYSLIPYWPPVSHSKVAE